MEELFQICMQGKNYCRTPMYLLPSFLGLARGNIEIESHILSIGIDKLSRPTKLSPAVLLLICMGVFASTHDITCVGWYVSHHSPDT